MIPEALLDDDTEALVESVTWADSNLLLNLRLLGDNSRWQITCVGASIWRLEDRFTGGLGLTDNDPVLWQTQFATYATYFKGRPSDPRSAVCDLLSKIPRSSGVLGLTPNGLADLLNTGNGSLGPLPVPAFRSCQSILRAHGVEVYHVGADQSQAMNNTSALFFGESSYIVAEQFNAERQA